MGKHAVTSPGKQGKRCLLSQRPAGPWVDAARGQNGSQWWLCGCSVPRGQQRVAQQCGPQPGPCQQQPPSEEEHLFSIAWHGEGAILLLLTLPAPSASILSLPTAGVGCLLPSARGCRGRGIHGKMPIGVIFRPDTLMHPRHQIAAGALWQTLLTWMMGCVTHGVCVSTISPITY